MAPGKWLIEQRLKYAKMRLLTTDESINDIAFHAGFETTSNFIRCFKKIHSCFSLIGNACFLNESAHSRWCEAGNFV